MARVINGYNSVQLQIESSRTDVYVPDGVAISNGRYDILPTDLANVLPMGITKTGDVTGITNTLTQVTGWTITDPATVLTNDGIVIQQDFYGLIMFSAGYAKAPFGYSKLDVNMTIKVNGQIVREYIHKRNDSDMFYIGSLKAGDVVTFHTSYYASRRVRKYINGSYQYVTEVATGKLLAANTNASLKKYRRDAIDPVYDLVYPDGSAVYYGVTSQTTGRAPDYGKEYKTFYDATVSGGETSSANISKDKGNTFGPILAQSRQPLPVEPGYLVDFTGKFRMRGYGEVQKDKNEATTSLKIRYSLWGVVNKVDEYGTERADRELVFEEFTHTTSFTVRDYWIQAHDPIEIPDDIREVYFTCALRADTTDEYQAAMYKSGGTGPAYNTFFLIYNDNPLIIDVQLPTELKTYTHAQSSTGVAFKYRRWFDNMTEAKQLTFMGKPDTPVTISVYQSSNHVRGSLIGSYTAAANQRRTIAISSAAGQIELDSTRHMPTQTYGMDKSGTQQLSQNVWTDLTPFVLRSPHMGTITGSNTWVATEDCVAVVNGSITYGSTADTAITKGYRVLVNGVAVKVNTNEDDTVTVTGTDQISLKAGDVVKFQAFTTSSTSARRVVQTSTYFTMTFIEQQDEYFIESVVPTVYDTRYESQNRIERTVWSDLSTPLSGIVATRDEFTTGKLQIKFVSNELANNDVLQPGKRVRLLMNKDAAGSDYGVLFTGTIRDYTTKIDYKNRPFIEVTVENAYRELTDTDGHYLYDMPIEYAPMLNTLGKPAVIDGLDVSGPWQAEADSPKNQPSAFEDGLKIKDSLEAMRNTNKGFIWVDRHDVIQYKSDVEQPPVITVADAYSRAPISYGKISKGTDSSKVLNKIKPNEYKFDFEALNDQTADSEVPPKVEKLASMTQVAEWFYDKTSIRAYGEREETFPVVRGTGKLEDIKLGYLGGGFKDWSFAICDDYQIAKNRVSQVMIIPRDFNDLAALCELDIFDPVMVLYKNEQHVAYVRKLEWTIVDNGVRLEVFFDRDTKGVAWTPVYELEDIYTDLYFDLY